ncbi:MAG: leucine-rich repeat domain-containing protein, partial [Oscillospiraceae bacterium]
MKKLIAGLVSAALALGCVALPAEVTEKIGSGSVIEASAETYGDFEYSILDDGTVEISGYTGSDSTLTIPGTIDGKKVTSIGGYAFEDCTSLTSITIPNSVTSIGSNAFNYCTSLTSITIPNSVTSIGGGAFNTCTSLTSITIPNSVTSIGYSAFENCTSLTSITIPNSVTSIEH